MVYREEEYNEYFDKYQEAQPQGLMNGPAFVYNLDDYIGKKDKLIFSAHGCAGEKGESTFDIARSIRCDKSIQFNLLLGDNVYSDGIQRPRRYFYKTDDQITHETIEEYYYNIYDKILSFCVLGNHDYNYWSMQRWAREKGPHIAIKQVRETYNYPRGLWKMPYRYYALIHDQTKTIIFILDSCTFAWDELQQNWLDDVYNAYPAFKNRILVMHHPGISLGKRAEEEHLKLYAPENNIPEDENAFKPFKDAETPIGNLIMNMLSGKKFDVLLCAHDHYFDIRQLNRRSGNTIQCTSGSAGNDRNLIITDVPNKSFVAQSFPGIKNVYLTENERLKKKNCYVKCIVDKECGILLKLVEANTGASIFNIRVSEETESIEDRLFTLLNIPEVFQEPFFKEENKLQNLEQISRGIQTLFDSSINSVATMDLFIKIRGLLIRTYLPAKQPVSSQYQTNIYGKIQPCRKTWWAVDVIISAYYLKLLLKLNSKERDFRLDVVERDYGFITSRCSEIDLFKKNAHCIAQIPHFHIYAA